jgi:heat shock protein HslJ
MDREAATADLGDIDGSSWRATRFGVELADTPTQDQEFSLEIQGDRLAGRSGCNRFVGAWKVVDDVLEIGPLASTMMWCDGLMELERSFLSGLESARDIRRDGDRLEVLDGDGNALIELVRSDPAAGQAED